MQVSPENGKGIIENRSRISVIMKINYAPDHSLDNKDADGVGDYPPELEVDTGCGYGSWKPGFLQRFNNPKVLLFMMCIFTLSQGNI